jgi:hypothetical protein
LASKADRFSRTDGTRLGTGNTPLPARMNQFERLQQFANLQKAPSIKFKDLEAAVSSTIRYNNLPIQVRADFIRMTDTTIMTFITVQVERKDIQYKDEQGVSRRYAHPRKCPRCPAPGRIFEDAVTVGDIPSSMMQEYVKGSAIYQKAVRSPVPPPESGGQGRHRRQQPRMKWPQRSSLRGRKARHGSLVLADLIEVHAQHRHQPVRHRERKVRPRLGETFNRTEKLGIYLQL